MINFLYLDGTGNTDGKKGRRWAHRTRERADQSDYQCVGEAPNGVPGFDEGG